jgi:hypothetical protein
MMSYLLVYSPCFYKSVPYRAIMFDTHDQLKAEVRALMREKPEDPSIKVFMINDKMPVAELDAFIELAKRYNDECYYHQIAFHLGEEDVG